MYFRRIDICDDKIFKMQTIRNHWKDKHSLERPWRREAKNVVKQSKKWASMDHYHWHQHNVCASIEVSFLQLLCSLGTLLMISRIQLHKYLLLVPFIIRITVISTVILWLIVMILISIYIMELCIGNERLKFGFNNGLISALFIVLKYLWF